MLRPFPKLLRRLPLTLKMTLITVVTGLAVWGTVDLFAVQATKTMFEKQLFQILQQQSQEDRLRFDRHLQAYHQVARLTVEKYAFIEYLEKADWFRDNSSTIRYSNAYPEWFLSPSALRSLALPRVALLLDAHGRAREIYHKEQEAFPSTLLNPSEMLLQKSRNQTHLAAIDAFPYLVTSRSVSSSGGDLVTLLLATPIDDRLLLFLMGEHPNRLVGLISADDKIILTSNNNQLLPPGTELDIVAEKYLIREKPSHDYGGAEIPVKFTSFISKERIEVMTSSFISRERLARALSAFVFVLSFILIMVWVTRRISRLNGRIEDFSRKTLGGIKRTPVNGDKLSALEESFQQLTDEVTDSHARIQNDAQKKARMEVESKQKQRLFLLLRSVMNALGTGVLIHEKQELHAANETMVNFIQVSGGDSVFDIEAGCKEERIIDDRLGNRHVFHLTSPSLPTGEKVILVRDITEHKKLEDQLRQSQKMESVGQLAGGIAHDFNNFLTAIMGYAHLLKIKLDGNSQLKTHAEQILSASEKAAQMTQSLLAFSRKQMIKPRSVDLNDIVLGMEKLLTRLIGEAIEMKTVLSKRPPIIMADPGQIEQVILNLVTNARDAMPDGGPLTIEIDIVDLGEGFIADQGYGKPGTYTRVSVNDSGAGIEESIIDKIFEPFFTTKEVGKGSGLGLSMVYGIAKQHSGFVNVHSEKNRGTTFSVFIPLVQAEVKKEDPRQLSPAGIGSETILIAEDNREVRSYLRQLLELSGYTVIEASNGEEAVNLFREHRDPVHLLITDIIMPKMNGNDAYKKISRIRPEIKVIFLSGYTADLTCQQGIIDEDINIILKPVAADDLLQKVREVLDQGIAVKPA